MFLFHLTWWYYLPVVIPLVLLAKFTGGSSVGSGQVTGIVGRMGSGKSYMATRIAWRRMWQGAKIVTNFSMHLECPPKGHKRWRCPCKLQGQWQRFTDWPDLLPLSDAVIIIDEVDLYAPSNNFHAITDEVRGKMKMARKYRLDIYWISQRETRVNSILRTVLTNEIAICRSFQVMGIKYFSAKFYDPDMIRKKGEHTARIGYFLRPKIANLYDTLELIQGSEYAGDETMANYNSIMAAEQEKRDSLKSTHSRRQRRQDTAIEVELSLGGENEQGNKPTGESIRQRRRQKDSVQVD